MARPSQALLQLGRAMLNTAYCSGHSVHPPHAHQASDAATLATWH